MFRRRGFTLIELLIVMAVIAILIAIAIPSFRGMQNEARKTKAQGDLRVIKIAIESYYKNTGLYPAEANYQTTLTGATPRILESNLYDPFGATSTTVYTYTLSTGDPTTAKYYIVYSVGINANGSAAVTNTGIVSASNEAIWESNGHL